MGALGAILAGCPVPTGVVGAAGTGPFLTMWTLEARSTEAGEGARPEAQWSVLVWQRGPVWLRGQVQE